MAPPAGDGGSPAPIDRPILEFLQTRLQATEYVERATITDASGHLELLVRFASPYVPATVDEATLTVRWYTNDDFKIHYREVGSEHAWECRWDRHPNPHNARDHFHPPARSPDARRRRLVADRPSRRTGARLRRGRATDRSPVGRVAGPQRRVLRRRDRLLRADERRELTRQFSAT